MTHRMFFLVIIGLLACESLLAQAPATDLRQATLGPYEYEVKPDHDAFREFNPRKAPLPGPFVLRESDRLAICGDSITEQKMKMTLVPFADDLNRFVLSATGGLPGIYRVQWGDASREYSKAELSHGVQLAVDFPDNPFCASFDRVDTAVAAKQAF